MTHCPGCGRFVGPHDACPTCGGRLSGRLPIRSLKVAAIALSTVGLAVLWLVASHAEVPTVPIGRVGATMNLAYVRVEGTCTRAPSYDPQTGYLSFWLADDTGELYVAAYRTDTEALVAEHRVPALGDWVSVAGTLRVRDDFSSLTLNAPGELAIVRPEPEPCAIAAISPEQTHRRVRVRGQVRRIAEPYPGLTLLTVRDQTGAIDLAVAGDVALLSGPLPPLEVGQPVEVTAAVSRYEGAAQLVPASGADVVPLDADVPIGTACSTAELSRDDVGRWAVVRGQVADAHAFSDGLKLTLDDGSGSVVVLLWQDVHDDLKLELNDAGALAPGAQIEVCGQLAEYRGELEVIPELASDVRIVAPAAAAPPTSIGSLSAEDVGRRVTVRGTLGPPQTFSAGVKHALRDQTGTIVLLLWSEVYESVASAGGLPVGATVEVTGEIDWYRGDLEIIPAEDGVRVVGD